MRGALSDFLYRANFIDNYPDDQDNSLRKQEMTRIIIYYHNEFDFSQEIGNGSTLLMWTARLGLAHVVERALQKNPKIAGASDALMWAIEYGHDMVIDVMLKNMAFEDISVLDEGKNNKALMAAVRRENLFAVAKILKTLLSQVQNNTSNLATLWQNEYNDDIVDDLFRTIEDFVVEPENYSSIQNAFRPNDNPEANLLLSAYEKSFTRITAMSSIEEANRDAGLKNIYGLSSGPFELMDRDKRQKALIDAAMLGDTISTKILLELMQQADEVNHKYEGKTAIAWASKYGHEEVVEILLNHKAVEANIADDDGLTPLMLATKYRRLSVVKTLLTKLTHKEIMSQNTVDGNTSLILANKGTNINSDIIILLLSRMHRRDIRIKDSIGNDAIDYAEKCGFSHGSLVDSYYMSTHRFSWAIGIISAASICSAQYFLFEYLFDINLLAMGTTSAYLGLVTILSISLGIGWFMAENTNLPSICTSFFLVKSWDHPDNLDRAKELVPLS
jgi:ankyrin repeat protein